MKTSKLFLLALLLAPSAYAGDDPLAPENFQTNPFKGVCEGQVLLTNAGYQKNKSYWDPLVNQCSKDIQILPDTGFISTMTGYLGEEADREKSVALLQKLGQRTLDTIDYNTKAAELWAHCARLVKGDDAEKGWFEQKQQAARELAKTDASMGAFGQDFYDPAKCESRVAELKSLVQKKGPDLRIAREAMKQTAELHNQVMGALRKGTDKAAEVLGLERIELPADGVPASADEKAAATKIVSEATKSAREEMTKKGEEEAARMLEWRKNNPTAPLEAVTPPVEPWVIEYYKGGGGRGFDPLPNGAQVQLDHAIEVRVHDVVFSKSFADYAKTLGEVPVLGYLDKRDPSADDIAKAADQVLANAKKSRADVEKTLAKGNTGSSKHRMAELQSLLQNGPVLRDLLKDDPSSCGVAAGLENFLANKSTRNGALLAAGLVIGGIGVAVVGPAVLVAGGLSATAAASVTAAGIAAGNGVLMAGQLHSDYENYKSAKAHAFSVVHTDQDTFGAGSAVAETDQYWDARNGFVINAATTLAMTVGPGARAAERGVQLLRGGAGSQLANEAVLARLMARDGANLSESEAKATVRNLASTDQSVAQAAIKTVQKAMGVSEDEMALYQKAVTKQLLDDSTKSELTEFSKRLNALKGPKGSEQRKVLVERMNQILDQVKGTEMAGNKKADAMRVVLAASEFGPYDNVEVAQRASGVAVNVAEKVNSWNEGLGGLARTYEQARLNLQLPEIQALEPSKRLEAAYAKALEQLGVTDPALRASMLGCGLGSAR